MESSRFSVFAKTFFAKVERILWNDEEYTYDELF